MPTATACSPTTDELIALHGEDCRERIEAGVARVRERWTDQDGDAEAMHTFCMTRFVANE